MSTKFQVIIDIRKNRVVKSGPSEVLELEFLMTNKAYAVSRNHEKFRVPKVLSFDVSLGILEMEFIPNISPLKPLLYEKGHLISLLEKTAEAIFIIHEKLVLEEKETFYLPNMFLDDACLNTAIHGDFTLRNVQYEVNKNIPVFIDWSFCPKYHVLANFGCKFFDIAFMVNSIFTSPPYSYFFQNKERYRIAIYFIESYFRLNKSIDEYNKFKKYLQNISRVLYLQSKVESTLSKKFKERKNRIAFIEFADSL